MSYNPTAIKIALIHVATEQWLPARDYTILVAKELGILQPDRELHEIIIFLLGSLTTGEGLIETKRVSTDTGGYSYVSRKRMPPDLKDVETEDTENARQLKALNAQVREMFNADPVMVQMCNTHKSTTGESYVLCRKHYTRYKQRISKIIPHVILQIIALVPISRECSHCEDEKERQTHADPQEIS